MDFSVSQEGIIIILTFSPRHSKAGVVKPKIQKGGGRDGEQKGFRETRHLGGGEWDLGSDSPARWTSAQIRPTFARERGGSSGPRHPLCGAGSSQHDVPAETLCSGPHSDPLSVPPTLLLGFFSSQVASLLSSPSLPRDPSVLAPFSSYFPRTQESASIACWNHEP